MYKVYFMSERLHSLNTEAIYMQEKPQFVKHSSLQFL